MHFITVDARRLGFKFFLTRGVRIEMFFLTNELAKEAEITILSARDTTRPGLQAAGSWVTT